MKRLAAALLASTFLTAPTLVRAEPISMTIAAVATTIGVSTATVTTALAIGASIGISLISSALKPADPTETSPDRSGATLNVQYGAAIARSANMGPGATGGHHVYTNVWGNDNSMLQVVFVIGDGQHGKLTRLKYNGTDCTLPAGGMAHGTEHIVPEFIGPKSGNFNVVVRYYAGHYDQTADAKLVSNSNPPGRWTTSHRGRGVAYLVVDQAYVEDQQLTGIPQVLIETEGLVLYDPRKDSTNGGSGPHRWGDVSTYEPSSNPAVQEYNFRRGITVNGQRILGMSISPVNLVLQMYLSAANINDEPVPLAAGGTEPRYRCSVNISDDRANSSVLDSIRASTAGWSLERGGQFGPLPGVPQIPIASLAFTDDDLIVGEHSSFTKYRSRSDIITAMHGTFSDPEAFWQSSSFPARENTADDALIGERIARDIDLTQVFSSSQAQRIAESERRRTLQQGQGTVTLPAKWIGVQPGDWLTYNSARHGNMTVLVTSAALDVHRHQVVLTYEKIANSVYSWTTAGELFPPDVGAGGVPGFIIMMATGMTAVGVDVPGDGGLVTPGIAFAWDPIIDPSVDQIDFEIRKVGDIAVLPFTADFPSAGSAVCSGHGIQAATNYEYRHKLYTTPVRDTDWSSWLTVLSGTNHVVPTSLTSAPIGAITLAMFEQGLKDYVANRLSAALEEVDRIEQLIASVASEQEAANYLDLLNRKEADVAIRGQISTLTGSGTWRGEWDAAQLYHPNDTVSHLGDLYTTAVDVSVTEPPAAPWAELLTAAVISEEWKTFAGTDGIAAQTSDRIEARFVGGPVGGTPNDLTMSVASVTAKWSAFAGGDFAAAQTSQSIEARFGDMGPGPTYPHTLASVSNEWSTFAGPTAASAATWTQLVASIDGSSASVAGNQTAAANIDGRLAASYSLTLNVNGYVAGMKFLAAGGGGATTSNVIFLTDNFLIAKPGISGPTPIFSVGSVNGAPNQIVFSGNFISDGTITGNAIVAGSITGIKIAANTISADKLVAETVDTAHITGGALTVTQSQAYGATYGNSTHGFTLSIPNTVAGSSIPILVIAKVSGENGNAVTFDTQIRVAGTPVGEHTLVAAGSAVNEKFTMVGVGSAVGNGGTVNVAVDINVIAPGLSSNGYGAARLDAFAFKR